MESPFLQPSFLVPAASGVITFIVWLVRLESKTSTINKDLSLFLKTIDKLEAILSMHVANGEIHFNHRISQEVDKRNEHRFQTIEGQLQEINRKLDRIAGRN